MLWLILLPAIASAQPVDWLDEQYNAPGYGPDVSADDEVALAMVQNNQAFHAVFSAGGSLASTEQLAEWGGELEQATGGPAVSRGGGETWFAWKTQDVDGDWDLHAQQRIGNVWSAPFPIQIGVERGWTPQIVHDSEGATIVATAANGPDPAAWARAWRIRDGVQDGVQPQLLPARSDDRVDVANGALGERWVVAGDGSSTIGLTRSVDGGGNWTPQDSFGLCDGRAGQADAAADEDALYVVYGCSDDSDSGGEASVRHARIVDGVVVEDRVVTSPGALSGWGDAPPMARMGRSMFGSIVVVYASTPGGALLATSSDDGGSTWHVAEEIAALSSPHLLDAPAVAATGRVVFLFWSDGAQVRLRRGLAPILMGDDDDASGDDDDSSVGPVDDDDQTGDDDDQTSADDDDTGALDPNEEGCTCDAGGGSGLLLLPLLFGRRR